MLISGDWWHLLPGTREDLAGRLCPQGRSGSGGWRASRGSEVRSRLHRHRPPGVPQDQEVPSALPGGRVTSPVGPRPHGAPCEGRTRVDEKPPLWVSLCGAQRAAQPLGSVTWARSPTVSPGDAITDLQPCPVCA